MSAAFACDFCTACFSFLQNTGGDFQRSRLRKISRKNFVFLKCSQWQIFVFVDLFSDLTLRYFFVEYIIKTLNYEFKFLTKFSKSCVWRLCRNETRVSTWRIHKFMPLTCKKITNLALHHVETRASFSNATLWLLCWCNLIRTQMGIKHRCPFSTWLAAKLNVP